MDVNHLIGEKKVSKYRLAKETDIPYSTISDICSGKTTLENCNAKTVFALSKYFGCSMEDLLYKETQFRFDFEAFKSNVRHELKSKGYKLFIASVLKEDRISEYYNKKWYPEALYLLAMLDYVSRINGIPLCTRYDGLRAARLDEPIYPASVVARAGVMNDEAALNEDFAEAIPEFTRFNIVEGEVFDIA